MPNLAQTQELFWRLIRAPEGVEAAVAGLGARAELPVGLEAWIQGDERLDAVARLDVYANMYFFRLLECLTEDFPALHAMIGHESFHRLAADYLAAHPSRSPSLRVLGRALADFLDHHALSDAWPFAADLARFEWALLEAFDAADATTLGAERLRELAPDEWPDLRLELTPSLRIVEARAAVHELWMAAAERRALPTLAPGPTVLRVWREELRVFHRVIGGVELAALRCVQRGESFAAACEAASALVGASSAAIEVATLLQRWLADELVIGYGISPR